MQADSLISRLPQWAVIRDARRRQRRRWWRRSLLLLAVVGAAVAAGLLGTSAGGQGSSRVSTPERGSAVIGGYLLQARAAGDRVWVLTCVRACAQTETGKDQEQVVEVNASTGAVLRRLPLLDVSAFAPADRSLWVAHFVSGDLTRINPLTGRVTAEVSLRLPTPIAPGVRQFLPIALSAADGYLWVSTSRGWIAQIDLHTATLVRMVRTPSEDNATTTDRYGTWVAEDLDGFGILRPHRQRLRIRTVMHAGLPLDVYSVLSNDQSVWALADTDQFDQAEHIALLVDPRSGGIVRRLRIPEAGGAVVVGGALYLGGLDRGRIYRIDRYGGLRTYHVPKRKAALVTSSPGVLWAATHAKPARLLRITRPRG